MELCIDCGAEMHYIGNREWECTNCHTVYEIEDIDSDHPTCPRCGSTMDFHGHDDYGDFAYGDGYWECTGCGFKVSESDL